MPSPPKGIVDDVDVLITYSPNENGPWGLEAFVRPFGSTQLWTTQFLVTAPT
jgi:hypothetical protein